MRFFYLLNFSFILFFTNISCSTNSKNPEIQQNIHRKWMMISYKNFTKQELTKLKANIDLTSKTGNQYFAKMGCNSMFFTAKTTEKGKISVSKMGATMMYCNGQMKLEDSFVKDFPEMTAYSIDGHFLTISNEKGITMKFVAEDWD